MREVTYTVMKKQDVVVIQGTGPYKNVIIEGKDLVEADKKYQEAHEFASKIILNSDLV